MLITQFYENQDIFITGGTGFIGRVLIEKLLRSCPGIRTIYVLLRSKKGKCIDARLQEMLDVPLFNDLRETNPQALQKIVPIVGDCTAMGLGISPEDLAKLQNVGIIFHSAATVRFDEYLRDAVLMNTRSTHELMKIAENLKKLKVLVHVSTTYCYPGQPDLDEKINPSFADWRSTIKMAENLDYDSLDILFAKYSNHHPNTYTFTKNLAEQIIDEYKDKLPVIIVRPAIVICTVREPFVGWIDNFNGPLGLLIGCGMGLVRSNYVDPYNNVDMVPVDIVVKALIVASYKKGIESSAIKKVKTDVDVYNCAITDKSTIRLGELVETCKFKIRDCPFERTLWIPGGSVTNIGVLHYTRVIVYHMFMALLLDLALRCMGRKPMILKLQRRIKYAFNATNCFMGRTWYFKNAQFYSLCNEIPPTETDRFSFWDDCYLKYSEFLSKAILGSKVHLLKESPISSRSAFIKLHTFRVINHILEYYAAFVCGRFLYGLAKKYYTANYQ